MRILIALLILVSRAYAQDGFQWAITDKGDQRELNKVDVSECIHEISFALNHNTYSGTCVHIGKGWFLTARHVLQHAPGRRVLVDGKQVTPSRYQSAADIDFGLLIIPELADSPAVGWRLKPPQVGEPLTVMAKYTMRTAGLVSSARYMNGEIGIDLAADQPKTQQGDSGGAVIDASGLVLGIHTGSQPGGHHTFFTPLNRVAKMLGKEPVQVAMAPADKPADKPAEEKTYDTYALLFGASYCGPCKDVNATIRPRVEAAGWHVDYIDVEVRRDLVSKYRITRIPCWVFVEGEEELSRLTGTGMPAIPSVD